MSPSSQAAVPRQTPEVDVWPEGNQPHSPGDIGWPSGPGRPIRILPGITVAKSAAPASRETANGFQERARTAAVRVPSTMSGMATAELPKSVQ